MRVAGSLLCGRAVAGLRMGLAAAAACCAAKNVCATFSAMQARTSFYFYFWFSSPAEER